MSGFVPLLNEAVKANGLTTFRYGKYAALFRSFYRIGLDAVAPSFDT